MPDPTSPYRTIATESDDRRHDSDPDESSSTTDVESVLLETKEWHELDAAEKTRPGAARTSRAAWWRGRRGLLDTALIAANVVLSVLSVVLLAKIRTSVPSHGGDAPQVGGDASRGAPAFDVMVVKWEADATFAPNDTAAFFEPATVDRWRTLLPESAHRGDGETFSTTSMTHQLHCLFMMGRVYAGVTQGRTADLPADYHAHFLHCIDYIRQGIMCAGDVSLEPHVPTDADDLGPKDGGWNGLHVCKDYGQVLRYLDEQIEEGTRTVLPIDD